MNGWMDGVGRRTGCDFDGHGELSASEAAVRKGKETLWQQNQVTEGATCPHMQFAER
jgi:hypothetical protein